MKKVGVLAKKKNTREQTEFRSNLIHMLSTDFLQRNQSNNNKIKEV